MIIFITVIIVIFCLVGAAVAFSLKDGEGKESKWTATEERLSPRRLYSHVEQGPDSLYPLSRGNEVNKTETSCEED